MGRAAERVGQGGISALRFPEFAHCLPARQPPLGGQPDQGYRQARRELASQLGAVAVIEKFRPRRFRARQIKKPRATGAFLVSKQARARRKTLTTPEAWS